MTSRRAQTAELPEVDAAHLEELAIFPLPNAVLLPGGVLPLHVFEPRYRELTRDCLAGTKAMAIALLQPGFEASYFDRPAIHAVCGLGTIICSEELADGRFHLLLRGVGRIRVEHEHPANGHGYRVVRASWVDAHRSARPEVALAGHRQLLDLCDRLACVLDHGGHELCELVHAQKTPGECADVITAALVTDPRRRQALLETFDAADRVSAAVDLVGRVLCQLAPDGVLN
jgi:Lon protease-like protein